MSGSCEPECEPVIWCRAVLLYGLAMCLGGVCLVFSPSVLRKLGGKLVHEFVSVCFASTDAAAIEA